MDAVRKEARCDFCRKAGVDMRARYDFKTYMGPWANGCTPHYLEFRMFEDLGTGKAQLLLTEEEVK